MTKHENRIRVSAQFFIQTSSLFRLSSFRGCERRRKPEALMTSAPMGTSDFSHSFVIRHSSFVIPLARTQDSAPGVFRSLEQIEKRTFLRMIGTRRITGGRSNSAISFANQILRRQVFIAPKSPRLAREFVGIFGER